MFYISAGEGKAPSPTGKKYFFMCDKISRGNWYSVIGPFAGIGHVTYS